MADSSQRSPSQIEADLGATRDRLASSVEALIDQVYPAKVKQRVVARLKGAANAEIEGAKAKVFNARGDLRTDRVAAAAGAVAGVVGFVLILRAIVQRARG